MAHFLGTHFERRHYVIKLSDGNVVLTQVQNVWLRERCYIKQVIHALW